MNFNKKHIIALDIIQLFCFVIGVILLVLAISIKSTGDNTDSSVINTSIRLTTKEWICLALPYLLISIYLFFFKIIYLTSKSNLSVFKSAFPSLFHKDIVLNSLHKRKKIEFGFNTFCFLGFLVLIIFLGIYNYYLYSARTFYWLTVYPCFIFIAFFTLLRFVNLYSTEIQSKIILKIQFWKILEIFKIIVLALVIINFLVLATTWNDTDYKYIYPIAILFIWIFLKIWSVILLKQNQNKTIVAFFPLFFYTKIKFDDRHYKRMANNFEFIFLCLILFAGIYVTLTLTSVGRHSSILSIRPDTTIVRSPIPISSQTIIRFWINWILYLIVFLVFASFAVYRLIYLYSLKIKPKSVITKSNAKFKVQS